MTVKLSDRATLAEIAIREACADFMTEIQACADIETLNRLHWVLQRTELYLSTVTDAAAVKAEDTLAKQ